MGETVDLVGALKTASLSLDGLTMAATGHVTALQAARRKAQEDAASPNSPDSPSSSSGVEPLPGPDRTMYDLIANTGKSSRKQAGAEISLANLATESFPGFVASMRKGEISADYLTVLKQVARTPDLLTKAETDETRLLTLARELSVDEFRKSIRAWLFQHAPQIAEREVKRQERQEKFSVFAAEEGGYKITGWLTGLNGTALNMALRNQIGVPAKTDRRHHSQRCADALMDIINNTGTNAGNHVGHTGASDLAGGAKARSMPGYGAEHDNSHSQSATNNHTVTGTVCDSGTGPDSGTASSSGSGSGIPRSGSEASGQRGLRHQILVHVSLSTLVRTEEAIETGCASLPAADTSSDGRGHDGAAHNTSGISHDEATGGNSGNRSDSRDALKDATGPVLSTTGNTVAGNASLRQNDSGPSTGGDLFSSLDDQQGAGLFSNSDNPIAGTGTNPDGDPSLGELCPDTEELRPHGTGSPGGVGDSCPHDNTSPETTKNTVRKKARDRVGETFDVGQPPDWARPRSSPGQLRPHPSESGHVSPSGAGCSTTGRGLGRQGACLDGRANVERELGAVLGEIRAGIDVDMLEGYSPARLSD
ncbi:MAG: DUF222 domain-containing protein, partial [Ancrocorticia sp.]|uniref:DUF222 domain-containing protein n=1 Tax=Ancrocorticia sp. TaxID=2593684 RepID=UPI003F922B98